VPFQIGERVDDFLGFEGAIPLADSHLGQRACLGEPRYGFVGLREAAVYQLCGAVDGKHGCSRQRMEEQVRGRSAPDTSQLRSPPVLDLLDALLERCRVVGCACARTSEICQSTG
jgi:hypothetical protein